MGSLLLGNILFEAFFSGVSRNSRESDIEYVERPLPTKEEWNGVRDRHTGATGKRATLEYFATVTARAAKNELDVFVHRDVASTTPLFTVSKEMLERIYIQDKIREDETNKRKY